MAWSFFAIEILQRTLVSYIHIVFPSPNNPRKIYHLTNEVASIYLIRRRFEMAFIEITNIHCSRAL